MIIIYSLDEGISCYSVVKSRSKDKRSRPENCKNMAKIVYNVLKIRDKLLRDKNFRRWLQYVRHNIHHKQVTKI